MAKLLAQTDTTLLHVNQVQYGNRLFFFSLNTNHAHKQTPTNRIHLKKKKKISQIFRILNRKKNLQKIIIIITRELAGGNENLQISSAKASVLDNIYTLDNI